MSECHENHDDPERVTVKISNRSGPKPNRGMWSRLRSLLRRTRSKWRGRKPVRIKWGFDFDLKEPSVLTMALDPGEVRAVQKGRCRACWGRLVGRVDRKTNEWSGIRCRVCGRTLEGEDAESEFRRMTNESIMNMMNFPLGRASKYDEKAKFVQKLFPAVEREAGERFSQRIEANAAQGGKEGWLTRNEFPLGSPGYFFLQAKVLMSGVERIPRDMTVASFPNFDVHDDGSATVFMPVAGLTEDPQFQSFDMMQKLGSTMTVALMSAFACELAMKAIRLTRLDEARKTHDLLTLYRDLPEDSRIRIELDCPEIESVLETARHSFGKWRYFETNVGGGGVASMGDTERALALGKAARVIIDEAEVSGLTCAVKLDATQNVTVRDDVRRYQYRQDFEITAGENSRPVRTNLRRPVD